jgi:hypothetical protein
MSSMKHGMAVELSRMHEIQWLSIYKRKVLEFVRFDSPSSAALLLFAYTMAKYYYIITNKKYDAAHYEGKIFRHVNMAWARRRATRYLQSIIKTNIPKEISDGFIKRIRIQDHVVERLKSSIIREKRPFDRRLIILSPPMNGQLGVLLVKFTDYFPYLTKVFDLGKLSKDYMVVLEPSGAGYFDEYILCLMEYQITCIIQSAEPVDYEFIESLNTNIYPIDIGANCWVDDRVFHPLKYNEKEFDIIMVSIWADFKRHYHLFEALSRCKKRNEVKIALVGRPYPRSLESIKQLANYYGVKERISFFEDIRQDKINELYNQSKVYLLLSKKEGFNKAIIEAMNADVPGFLLKGFNYGHHYDYINDSTGGFIDPSRLHEFIDNIDDILKNGHYSPRRWVKQNMSYEISTRKLIGKIEELEQEKNIRVNKSLEYKINNPDCDYVDESNWERYRTYYNQLASYLK